MTTALRVTVALLWLSMLPPAQALAQPAEPPRPPTRRIIQVTGEGTVNAQPDVARVLIGTEATGKDLGRVADEVAARMRKVLAALTTAGVAGKDVRTVRHEMTLERNWKSSGASSIAGYTVVDQVQVTVRDLPNLGTLLDAVARAGANTIEGLRLEKEDPTPERNRALGLAYAAARTKAEALAQAAKITLGDVLLVDESTRGPSIPFVDKRASWDSLRVATPVATGQLEVTGVVQVTFAIE